MDYPLDLIESGFILRNVRVATQSAFSFLKNTIGATCHIYSLSSSPLSLSLSLGESLSSSPLSHSPSLSASSRARHLGCGGGGGGGCPWDAEAAWDATARTAAHGGRDRVLATPLSSPPPPASVRVRARRRAVRARLGHAAVLAAASGPRPRACVLRAAAPCVPLCADTAAAF